MAIIIGGLRQETNTFSAAQATVESFEANVEKAVEKVAEIAEAQGVSGIKIVGVLGDNVYHRLDRYADSKLVEANLTLGQVPNKVAANAYLGCAPIVQALKDGADIVITGRCSDPALFLGPLVYEFGWPMDDFRRLGMGTLVGHLLECSGQVSGGNFCIPGEKDVDRLWEIGYPIAEVQEDGVFFVTKVEGTGGRIDADTCTEQLLYEIHDPAAYITPDCVADFSAVVLEQAAPNRVKVSGGNGKPHTGFYKVSVGYLDGYTASMGLSYGGHRCFERAVAACEVMERIIQNNYVTDEYKIDLIGYNSLFPRDIKLGFPGGYEPLELRMRIAVRAQERETLAAIADDVDTLTISGPANGGGLERNIRELLAAYSFLIPREEITVSYVSREVEL